MHSERERESRGGCVRKPVLLSLAVMVGCVCSVGLNAQTKHTPSLEESLSLKTIGGARISPDGRFIAYRVRETDWKENAYVRQIWLANIATGASFQLTRGKKSSDAPEWSPDGRWLAFVGEREANAIVPASAAEKKEGKEGKEGKDEKKEGEGKPAARQIWVISPEGGEAWQLTQQETDIGAFHWSKDGKQIAFTASTAESKSEKERKEKYSEYEVFEEDFRQNQLWIVDASEGEAQHAPVKGRQITHDASLNVNGFAWSPDGKRIAFAATHNPMLAFAGDEDIYLAELAKDTAVRKIIALDGPDGDPIFSPDGKQIAFGTALAQPYFYYANSHIALVDVERVLAQPATKPADVQDLTAQFDEDGDIRIDRAKILAAETDGHDRAGKGLEFGQRGSDFLEKRGWRDRRRDIAEAGELRCFQKISFAGDDPWRADGNLAAAAVGGRYLLSDADFFVEGGARASAELSRQRGVWRGVSGAERTQSGCGGHVGRDERRRLTDRPRDCR